VELDVVVSEFLGVIRPRRFRHVELLLGHVHADDPAPRPHELGRDVHVPTGAAPQVEYRHPLDLVGDAEPASVVLGDDVVVYSGYGMSDVRGGGEGRAARVRLQVGRFLESFAVVCGDGGVRGGFVDDHGVVDALLLLMRCCC